jgi:hypothetical protein
MYYGGYYVWQKKFMQHHAYPNDNSQLGGSYFVAIAMNVPSTLEFYNPSMC